MKFSDMPAWVPLVAALVGASMYIGALAQRVTNLEQENVYLHGHVNVPEAK